VRVLYLVRHGEAAASGELTAVGRLQARQAAARIADASVVLTSDLPRARQTADVIAAATGVRVVVSPGLREAGDPPPVRTLPDRAVLVSHAPTLARIERTLTGERGAAFATGEVRRYEVP
jgi:phosphohistidine phosphatase SixA